MSPPTEGGVGGERPGPQRGFPIRGRRAAARRAAGYVRYLGNLAMFDGIALRVNLRASQTGNEGHSAFLVSEGYFAKAGQSNVAALADHPDGACGVPPRTTSGTSRGVTATESSLSPVGPPFAGPHRR